MPQSGLRELLRLHDAALAEIIRGRLAADGVEAFLFDTGLSGLLGGAYPGVRIMVRETDLANARLLLDLPNS